MQQWECIVCGWIYDEAAGDPDSGIAPGTKFEDIPNDWMCPECGVGKDDFELVDVPDSSTTPSSAPTFAQAQPSPSSTPNTTLDEDPIVIIGSGLAGYGLLKELRKEEIRKSARTTPVVIVTSDDGRSYSKPALSTGYTKNTSASDLSQMDAGGMAAQYNASVWTMTKVTSIDSSSRTVSLNNGSGSLRYSKLVLALGANCIEPPIDGDALDHLYSINDLMDFARFQNAVAEKKAKKICVIGAGLIGCEYTNDLINGGFEVDIVDPLSTCLPALLPEVAGNAVKSALQNKGASFHFGKTVVAVNDDPSNGVHVELNDESVIEADLVVSAVGVRPHIALAEQSGLAVNRGVQTNATLETSEPDIYALGDCAEVEGLVLVYVAPLVTGTRALAKTLCGEPTAVNYPAMPVAVKTPACPVVVCPPPHGVSGEWQTIKQDGNSVHAEYLSDDGSLLGFALTDSYMSEKATLQKKLPDLLD